MTYIIKNVYNPFDQQPGYGENYRDTTWTQRYGGTVCIQYDSRDNQNWHAQGQVRYNEPIVGGDVRPVCIAPACTGAVNLGMGISIGGTGEDTNQEPQSKLDGISVATRGSQLYIFSFGIWMMPTEFWQHTKEYGQMQFLDCSLEVAPRAQKPWAAGAPLRLYQAGQLSANEQVPGLGQGQFVYGALQSLTAIEPQERSRAMALTSVDMAHIRVWKVHITKSIECNWFNSDVLWNVGGLKDQMDQKTPQDLLRSCHYATYCPDRTIKCKRKFMDVTTFLGGDQIKATADPTPWPTVTSTTGFQANETYELQAGWGQHKRMPPLSTGKGFFWPYQQGGTGMLSTTPQYGRPWPMNCPMLLPMCQMLIDTNEWTIPAVTQNEIRGATGEDAGNPNFTFAGSMQDYTQDQAQVLNPPMIWDVTYKVRVLFSKPCNQKNMGIVPLS